MPLGREVGFDQGDIVLDRDPAPPQKRGHSPQFLAHVCCGQMAGWIKMPLGMKVGLSPGHTVRWGPSSLPKGAGHSPKFLARVYCSQTVTHLSYCWALVLGSRAEVFMVSASSINLMETSSSEISRCMSSGTLDSAQLLTWFLVIHPVSFLK